jgi:hypothetical protein
LVAKPTSGGTPALRRRTGSAAQSCGRYSRYATGRLAARLATDSDTATWQLSCLPSCPQYCRVTPTECRPFLGNPVSSMIHASIGPPRSIDGSTRSRTLARTRSSDHGAFDTKCSSDWCCAATRAGAVIAASGSTLLRSAGINSPRQ